MGIPAGFHREDSAVVISLNWPSFMIDKVCTINEVCMTDKVISSGPVIFMCIDPLRNRTQSGVAFG